MRSLLVLLPLALAGCGQAPAAPAPHAALPSVGTAAAPVVVELFQSQGCSSCPPANAAVNAIADAPGVLALSFAVTYWDQLGWKDIFGSPAWTARQWAYAHHAGRAQVATPQVIVNGGPAIIGSNRAELAATIAREGPAHGGPAIGVAGDRVTLAAGKGATATAWLVRYDPRTIAVPIRAGENDGRTLPHRDIVRELVRLGDWTGAAASFPITAGKPGLASAVLVQQGAGGPIVAARKL